MASKIAGLQPARTALPAPNSTCSTCDQAVNEAALQCGTCSNYVHAACTGLPRYCVLHYFTSRSIYCCESCVNKRHGSSAEINAWIDANTSLIKSPRVTDMDRRLSHLQSSIDEVKSKVDITAKVISSKTFSTGNQMTYAAVVESAPNKTGAGSSDSESDVDGSAPAAESWTTVVRKKAARKNGLSRRNSTAQESSKTVSKRPVLSSGTANTNELQTVSRTSAVHVFATRFHANVKAENLASYMTTTLSIDPDKISVIKLKTRHDSYSSFKVSCHCADRSAIMQPQVWPKGCLFRRWRQPARSTNNSQ